jgi:hypothetical protein
VKLLPRLEAIEINGKFEIELVSKLITHHYVFISDMFSVYKLIQFYRQCNQCTGQDKYPSNSVGFITPKSWKSALKKNLKNM